MTTKLKNLFSSIRFWQLLVVAIIQTLVVLNLIDSEQGVAVANIFSIFLGAVVTIGTVDKRSSNTTVSIPSNVSSVTATTE